MSNLTVFIGRWSEMEMMREGFEPDAPERAVAASSRSEAIRLLGCPRAWFNMNFKRAGKRDLTISELCSSNPGKVFELHYEEVPRRSEVARIHHWVGLDEVQRLLEEINKRKVQKTIKSDIGDNQSWQDRVKDSPRVVMLRKCA